LARFVAYGANYSHGVRSEISEPTATGVRVTRRGLEAQFEPRGLTDYDLEQILKSTVALHGLPEDSLEGGEISPRSRLGVFDSRKAAESLEWTDEDHDLVVEKLRASSENGLRFIEILAPKRPAPWNGYDNLDSAERILAAVDATGVDPAEVIAYERENADREEVIAALTELLPEEELAITIDAS
jgi:hypothetical protein